MGLRRFYLVSSRQVCQDPPTPALYLIVVDRNGEHLLVVEESLVGNRAFGEVYRVVGRDRLWEFIIAAAEASGARVMYASPANRAPIYLGLQLSTDERIGVLVYPFTVRRNPTRNRPDDEVRGQLRYGSEASWTREHPVGRDIAGVDATLILGVDVDEGIFLGLDPEIWDPLPMGISFYAKDAEIQIARTNGWHVWEKVNRSGSRRAAARSLTNFETVVAFRPDRFIDYVRLERRASALRLDPPLRFSTAVAMARPGAATGDEGRHILEEKFRLTSEQILDIIEGRNRLAVAVRGGVAEYHLEHLLIDSTGVARVDRLDVDAKHDFDVTMADGRSLRIECKNASPKTTRDGQFKVEVQKTRASQGDPASRFYAVDAFDVVAACVYSATGRWEFKFGRTTSMARHSRYPDRLAAVQTITDAWTDDLANLG